MHEPGSIAALRGRYVPAVAETARQVLDEGRTPAKAEELALVAARYAEGELAAWNARPDAPAVACRVGCSACCHVPVGVTIPEAVLVAATLRDEATEAELAEVLARARRAEAARLGLVGVARDRLRHPCPLLDEAGACSVYEVRPLNCRGWNSLDRASCERYFDDPSGRSTIPIDAVRRTITQAIAEGVHRGLESSGLEHPAVDLATALRILLEDPDAAGRWLAGKPAFLAAEVPWA